MRTIRFKDKYETEYNIVFYKGRYMRGNGIYVCAYCEDEEYGGYSPYCDITINLMKPIQDGNYAFLDTNNADLELIDLMVEKGWIEKTGYFDFSGYCSYPLVKFTDEFLNEINEL